MKTPNNSFNSSMTSEDNKFIDQYNQTFEGFYKEPQSMKMLSIKLNIDRSNICWFCRELRKNNQIGIVKKAFCAITKRRVNYYTTNPELIPKYFNQLSLFNDFESGNNDSNPIVLKLKNRINKLFHKEVLKIAIDLTNQSISKGLK